MLPGTDQRSYNQLLNSPIPISSGYPTVRINTGEISNRGLEAIISMRWVDRSGFSWETALNVAGNRNRLESLSDGADLLELAGIWGANGPAVGVKAGQPYGIIVGFDYLRDDATGLPLVNENVYRVPDYERARAHTHVRRSGEFPAICQLYTEIYRWYPERLHLERIPRGSAG
jgi:hypothetical protein